MAAEAPPLPADLLASVAYHQNSDVDNLPFEFACNGFRFATNDGGASLLAWLSLGPRAGWRVEALVQPTAPRQRMVITVRVAGAPGGDRPGRDILHRLIDRLREAFDPSCRPARNASVALVWDARDRDLHSVVDGLECFDGRTMSCLADWLLEGGRDAGLVPSRGGVGYLPLAGGDGVVYLGSAPLGGGSPTAPVRPTAAELARTLPHLRGERGARDPAPFTLATPRCWSVAFKAFVRGRALAAAAATAGDRNRYAQEYARALEDTRAERIDLSVTRPCFGPGLLRRPGELAELINESAGDDLPVFAALRSELDKVVAYDNSSRTYFLKVMRGGQAELEESLSYEAMREKMRDAGFTWEVPAPEDHIKLAAVLNGYPGFKPAKPPAMFDVYIWYLTRGRRVSNGCVFYPCGPGETLQDPFKINTFRGWGALRMVPTPPSSWCWPAPPADAPEPAEPGLPFLLHHIANVTGEGWAEARELLIEPVAGEALPQTATARFIAFWANMILTPREKWPQFWIMRGGQGIGKSRLMNEMYARLLNARHCMTFTDAQRLADDKNGHLRDLILAFLEEASPNDLDRRSGNKLKEIISGNRAYFRSLYKEGEMSANWMRIVFATNHHAPAVTGPGDRRTQLCSFNVEIERRLDASAKERERYNDLLTATLASDAVWTDMARLIWLRFSGERLAEYARTVHNQRTMNPATLNMQLESMDRVKDTSILGWLYRVLLYHEGFFPRDPCGHFVSASYESTADLWPAISNYEGASFRGKWRELVVEPPGSASPAARNEMRRAQADEWWTRGSVAEFYESYKNRVDRDAQFTELQFAEHARALFGGLADLSQRDKYDMRERNVYHNGKMVCMWYLPPLRQLEQLFIQALPTVQGRFEWDKFRAWKDAGAVALRASTASAPTTPQRT